MRSTPLWGGHCPKREPRFMPSSSKKEAVMAIDQRKLQALLGRAVADIGANLHAARVVTGDKLGLFRALHPRADLDPRPRRRAS